MKTLLRTTTRIFTLAIIVCIAMGFSYLPKANCASIIDEVTEVLKSGTPTLELRLGYEYSDLQDNHKDSAKALNLRTRVGYRTGEYLNSSVYIQLHDLTTLADHYAPEDTDYDVIADPEGNRVHQVFLDFKGLPDTTLRLGRQEIILNDSRLIGNIGWRQNGQSFDAVSLTNTSIKDLKLYGAYVNQVNTILLDYVDLDALVLLNAKYTGIKGLNITGFCYLLDTKSDADSARDSATYGLRLNGKIAVFDYDLTGAYQSDFADGEDHDGYMINTGIGYTIAKIRFGAGYHYISGLDGDDRPFDTLFSTAHKFNGWADVFLSTNGGKLKNGLEDYFVEAGTKLMGVKLKAVYHYFDTTDDDYNNFDDQYGDEIDLLLVKKINKNLTGLLKYSHYNEMDHSASYTNVVGGHDEDVFWARLTYKF